MQKETIPGTPQTLKQAIENGIDESTRRETDVVEAISRHVIDFAAQGLCGVFLQESSIEQFWNKFRGKKIL